MSDEKFSERDLSYRKQGSSTASHDAEYENEALPDRRTFLAGAASLLGMVAVSSCSWQEFFQDNFRRMSKTEIEQTIYRLQEEYKKKYGKEFVVGTEAPLDATLFGYGLDIQRCIGCRRCVYGLRRGEQSVQRSPDPVHQGTEI